MVGAEWIARIAIPLAAQFAIGNLLALLDAEPSPLWRVVRRRSTVARPLARLPWSADVAAVAVCREHATGQARSLCPHALAKAGSAR